MLFGARMPLPSPRGPRRHPRGCVVVTLGRGWGSTRNRPNGRRGEESWRVAGGDGVTAGESAGRATSGRGGPGVQHPPQAVTAIMIAMAMAVHSGACPASILRSRIRGFRFPSGPFRAGPGALRFGSAAGSFRAREGRVALVGRGGILGTGLTERGRQQEFSPGDWPIESGLAERGGVEEYFP